MNMLSQIDSQKPVASAEQEIQTLLARVSTDVGAPFETSSIDLLRTYKEDSPADFQRIRASMKKSNSALRIGELDKAIGGDSVERQGPDSIADTLTAIAMAECVLFHDQDNQPYASFQRDGHTENWPVWSTGYSEWLSYRCFVNEGKSPRKAALEDALATIAGQAKFAGEEKDVAFRIAEKDGSYYLDLADEHWRAIEINQHGWDITDKPQVLFIRKNTMRPITPPVPGGDISLLWNFANIPKKDEILILTWLIEGLRAETPFAVLELIGEQGSAKSSTQSVLRDLIDPNEANLRGAPGSTDDIFIAAKNNHLVSFENLSHLSPQHQDALCILATGGAHAKRTFYTNDEETIIKIKRPVVINGISAVVVAQDLLSRSINIMMPEVQYQDAAKLKTEFEKARGSILGGILDLFVKALALLPDISIPQDQRPRMSDMAKLGEAITRSLDKAPGAFLSRYEECRREAIQRTVDSSPIASATISFMEDNPQGFSGLTKTLFKRLSEYRPDGKHGWPNSSKGFADAMRRAAPALRVLYIGVKMNTGRTNQGLTCSLTRLLEPSAKPDPDISAGSV